ncbi:MAG: transposase family protein [Oscillospiraceae bacterium]|jgi:hypothetical protein|nr:transposase family protein [Acidaminococcaceae bacterium]MBQ5523659.1 transposase family protein [Oscillospiraceae bacterium]MBQ1777705.1 transposase family protein [Acidaminococcaceae bacterium]MBQ2139510.1 transposase family protein [Acidaminococcaceae bacterium]MBQ2220902.1 transposase family protein [Acidaminococcaceae bacterium]
MKIVPDPRSPREKKHDLAEMLTYLVAAYICGRTSLRRCVAWSKRKIKWLRKGMALKNGIASVATISRLLSKIDEELSTSSRQFKAAEHKLPGSSKQNYIFL